ncbi:hypothetical protein [Halorubrum halophilum]|uniref:hypothetical protein n=1 Tax=Halorubrum halophilum TaxID=413816 RepID=UPI00186B0039|nr:hypothetical protein [Halorubrum halophilum]
MRFPAPDPSEYARNTAVVVATIATLQYTGLLTDRGGIDPAFLVVVAVTYPVFTYLINVIVANVGRGAE